MSTKKQPQMKEINPSIDHQSTHIEVYGARVHNLKNIDVMIPRNRLVVITGLSGSGKSSLAFDTLFAEGQRRYIETFSAYARNFLGNLERPDVDIIKGLSPVIAIEQKTTNKNPRSTVGTITEVYDFLRLLFARIGEPYSYLTGEKMIKFTDEEILNRILSDYQNKKIYLLAPIVRNRKGHYKELFEQLRKKGYLHVRIDGEIKELVPSMRLDRYKNHNIELVIDKLIVNQEDHHRLKNSIDIGMHQGNNTIMLWDYATNAIRHFSKQFMCPTSGIAYSDPSPNHFSFNSPQGACPTCKGIGYINQIDIDKIIPDRSLSIAQGGIVPLGKHKNSLIFWQIDAIGEKYGFNEKTPISEISDEALDEILNGSSEPLNIKNNVLGNSNYFATFEGVIKYIELQQDSDASPTEQKWASQFVKTTVCPECHGSRLNIESRHYKVGDKTITELSDMDISDLYQWILNVDAMLNEKQKIISNEIFKEIRTRLQFLLDVGLGYLSLNRNSMSLSGGESQRIRLATQIGSQLVNVLYILDEPSIGLHHRDNERLIRSLQQLRDNGNSVIVVEHDRDMMLAADYIIDLGPFAGRLGGNVLFAGTPDEMHKESTLTVDYLTGKKKIEFSSKRRTGNGLFLELTGAKGNNLKNVDVKIPLGLLLCVTGVSGSGKSSLIKDTLYPILSQHFYHSLQDPLPYDSIRGIEHIDKVIEVDQTPIGRTPRSNPATYTGIFSDIRSLFVSLPEAKIRGYKPGRFSFNVPGGRCEVCKGNGYKTIEMNFLPDVWVQCEACQGKRYNRETLEVRFKGKSIADVLNLTIDQAIEFFDAFPFILQKLKVLQDVGLGYIQLGQPSSTLSGGESQRIKLATELSKKDTGKTLYLLDEPTTGLHFEDIKVLLNVLNRLVDKGNSIIVIEHNPDIIKSADYIIDMGPEGGKDGGYVIAFGTPEEIAAHKKGATAAFLNKELYS
jgi:excinuclease ABC subunit A